MIFRQASLSHLLVFTHLWLNGSEAEQPTFIVSLAVIFIFNFGFVFRSHEMGTMEV